MHWYYTFESEATVQGLILSCISQKVQCPGLSGLGNILICVRKLVSLCSSGLHVAQCMGR